MVIARVAVGARVGQCGWSILAMRLAGGHMHCATVDISSFAEGIARVAAGAVLLIAGLAPKPRSPKT